MPWSARDFKDVRTQETAPASPTLNMIWYRPSTDERQQWNGSAWIPYSGPAIEALDEEFLDAFQASVVSTQADVETHLTLGGAAAHPASDISYAGGTGTSATDVEGALDELSTEKENTGTAAAAVSTHEALPDPHPGYLTPAEGDAAYAPLSHVGTGGTAHANALAAGAAGFLTGADKSKLDGIEANATADMTSAEVLTTLNGATGSIDADLLGNAAASGVSTYDRALAARISTRLTDAKAAVVGTNVTRSGIPADGSTAAGGATGWVDSDRVHLTAQTNAWNNGPWLVHTGTWTRPVDFDTDAEAIHGVYIKALQGTYTNSFFVLETPDPITLASTPQVWLQYPGTDEPTPVGVSESAMDDAISLSTSTVQGSLEDHTETTVSGAAHPATTIDTTQAGYADQEAVNTALKAAVDALVAAGSQGRDLTVAIHQADGAESFGAVLASGDTERAINNRFKGDFAAYEEFWFSYRIGTAANTGATLVVQYASSDSPGSWNDLISVPFTSGTATLSSTWTAVPSGLKSGTQILRLVGRGGDSTVTPTLGSCTLHFRGPGTSSYAAHRFGWGTTLSSWATAMGSGASLGFAGQLLEVIVNFDTPGTTDTTFQLERGVSPTPTTRSWSDLLASSLTMSANNYEQTFDVSSQNILGVKTDLFRIKIPTAKGTGASGLYVTTRWKVTG